MNAEYRFQLALPIDEVWPALLDLKRIVPCLPGASIESGENDEYVGRIKIKLGPIEMMYRGVIRLTKRDDAAHEAVLTSSAKEIKGGGAVSATLTLRAMSVESETKVTVTSDFTVSGKAAQFGRGVIDEVGATLIVQFADRLAIQLVRERLVTHIEPEALRAAPLTEQPVLDSARRSSASETEALDMFKLAGWSVARRALIPASIAVALIVAAWLYLSLRHG